MRFGFTGTQSGMTDHQKARLVIVLTDLMNGVLGTLAPQFHHGDCIGADAEAAAIAKTHGFWIVGWPCTITNKRAYFNSHDTHLPMEPLKRNHAIVNITERLI